VARRTVENGWEKITNRLDTWVGAALRDANSFADSKEAQSLGTGIWQASYGQIARRGSRRECESASYERGECKAGNWTANRRISLYCGAIYCA
jgi:hypothetical protein